MRRDEMGLRLEVQPLRELFFYGILCLTIVVTIVMVVLPSTSCAQTDGYNPARNSVDFSFSTSTAYQFSANVDGGGEMNVARYNAALELSSRASKDLRLGLGLSYEYDDYDFSGLTKFPVARPWSEVNRFGISVPVHYTFTDNWRLFVSPSVQWAGESHAKWDDALSYGAVAGISYKIRPDAVIGLGAGVYSNIEDTTVFPYITVNWQMTERLRLINPFRTSPAGPAGLELAYAIDKYWETGLGAAYRSYRFRLEENGPIPNGIGEYKIVPVIARISCKFTSQIRIDVYGGATFVNKIYIEDQDGHELFSTKTDIAPLIGLTFVARF
jgi:outer membrane receptor protein involved in Fe transport